MSFGSYYDPEHRGLSDPLVIDGETGEQAEVPLFDRRPNEMAPY